MRHLEGLLMYRTVTRTVGDLTDPEFRRERASKAARASHSIDAHVRAIAAGADQLTAEHTAILRPLLPPVPADGQGEIS
jgi:hypothetical protein